MVEIRVRNWLASQLESWPNVEIGQKMANGQLLLLGVMWDNLWLDELLVNKYINNGEAVTVAVTSIFRKFNLELK